MQFARHRVPVTHMPQPAAQRLHQPIPFAVGKFQQRLQYLPAQGLEQPFVAVGDDGVEFVGHDHRAAAQHSRTSQSQGDARDPHTRRQQIHRQRMADHHMTVAQCGDQPIGPATGQRDDRAGSIVAANRQALISEMFDHAAGPRILRIGQHDRHIAGHLPSRPFCGQPHRDGVRTPGQQQFRQFLTMPFPGRAGGRLFGDITVRGRGGELVDECEHRLGENCQDFGPEIEFQRGFGDMMPGDPRTDLIGGEQIGQLLPLQQLLTAHLLEYQLCRQPQVHTGTTGMRGAVFGEVQQPVHEQHPDFGDLGAVLVEISGIVRPFRGQQFPDLVQQIGHSSVEFFRQLVERLRRYRNLTMGFAHSKPLRLDYRPDTKNTEWNHSAG